MAEYRAQADNLDEMFNFDAFRATPRNLKVSGYFDADGNYHPNEVIANDENMVSGYWDADGNYIANDDMKYDDQSLGS